MKYSCKKQPLLEAVRVANGIVDLKSNILLLQYVVLRVEDNVLSVIAWNECLYFKKNIAVDVKTSGEIAVSGELLIKILDSIKSETIDFSLNDMRLHLYAGWQYFEINGVSTEDYPVFPDKDRDLKFEISLGFFVSSLKSVYWAANEHDPRWFIQGVQIRTDNDATYFVATDGHRLAVKQAPRSLAKLPDLCTILPKKTVDILVKTADRKRDRNYSIELGEEQVLFSFDDTIINSRVLDVKYPIIRKLLSVETNGSCVFEKTDLIEALESVKIIFKHGICDFQLSKGRAIVSLSHDPVGKSIVEMKAKQSGPDLQISFNPYYLLEFLGKCDGDEVTMNYSDSLNPTFFNSSDPSYIYLLMPIKQVDYVERMI